MGKSKEWFLSGLSRLRDAILDNWASVLLIAVTTGAAGWFTAATEFMSPYAPFSWVAASLIALFLMSSSLALFGYFRSRMSLVEFEAKRADTRLVNPLSGNFENQRIDLDNFFHPFFKPTTGARFRNCDLFGPAICMVVRSSLNRCSFIECDVVIMLDKVPSRTSTGFVSCTFENCNLFRVMLLMSQDQFDNFKKSIPNILSITYEKPKHGSAQSKEGS
jgi:hypothetical protein